MLPAARARRPPALSISAIRVVTVVFPLVPVTATSGTPRPGGGHARPARSRSRSGTPACPARR